MSACRIRGILKVNQGRSQFFIHLKLFWYKAPTLSVIQTFSFRLAESYSQLVKYYLANSMDVDKRLNWQVKEVVWKG